MKNVLIITAILFSIFSLVFVSSCKKKNIVLENIRSIANTSVSIDMIDGSTALVTATCSTTGAIDGIEVSLRGALTKKITLQKEDGTNKWKGELELSNNGNNGYVHGYFMPVYGGETHTDEGVNSPTAADPYLEWVVLTEIELGEATHVPTFTGGTSTIEISNVEEGVLVSVVATKTSDNTLLGEYAIEVNPSDANFQVIVNVDYPIYSTEVSLRVSVEDLVKNYQYITPQEEYCGLSFNGEYLADEDSVMISISGNNRPSTFTIKALDGSTLLNTYEGAMEANEYGKEFKFPVEEVNNRVINFIVTSPQNELCVYDEFSYTTPTMLELLEATHSPTYTGGTSTIGIVGQVGDIIVNVLATKTSDNTLLGEYAINVPASAETFEVVVDYTTYPIFNTGVNLRVSVENLVENYQYTTLAEESCGLNFSGSYIPSNDHITISISGNNRPSTFTFKAYNGSTLLNTYGGTMDVSEYGKDFTFPVEEINNTVITYVVTSPQHELCIYDEFSYTTPNRQTNIVVTGVVAGSLTPSGGAISLNYTNSNFPSGEVATITVSTSSTGMKLVDIYGNLVSSIELELPGTSGTKTYEFNSDRDENPGSFIHNSVYMSSVATNIVTLTQTYDITGDIDATQILPNRTSSTNLASFDLNTNYIGTTADKINVKIKTLIGNPWDYYNLIVINGINIPASSSSDWGAKDSQGFYTFTINSDDVINITNSNFVVVKYRSKDFTIGLTDVTEIKASVEVDFIDRSAGTTFKPESTVFSVDIQ